MNFIAFHYIRLLPVFTSIHPCRCGEPHKEIETVSGAVLNLSQSPANPAPLISPAGVQGAAAPCLHEFRCFPLYRLLPVFTSIRPCRCGEPQNCDRDCILVVNPVNPARCISSAEVVQGRPPFQHPETLPGVHYNSSPPPCECQDCVLSLASPKGDRAPDPGGLRFAFASFRRAPPLR